MSQRRGAGHSRADNDQVASIWHSVVDSLRNYPATDAAHLQRLNDAYPAETEAEPKHFENWIAAKTSLAEQYDREAAKCDAQASILAAVHEQLDILLALKRAPDSAGGLTVNTDTSFKRKRARLSPTSTSRLSPAVTSVSNGSPKPSTLPLSVTTGRQDAAGRASSPAVAPTSASASQTTKQRRIALEGQLPLSAGRRVVFRVPSKNSGAERERGKKGQVEEAAAEGEGWILAEIVSSIGGDKSRYVVRDADDPKDGATYNTTIRSIVPLADPNASPSNPAHPNFYDDQPPGTHVLALYPDTTSFYRAVVVHPPASGTAGGRSAMSTQSSRDAKRGKYVLRFEDDGPDPKEVDAGLVVELPGGA